MAASIIPSEAVARRLFQPVEARAANGMRRLQRSYR